MFLKIKELLPSKYKQFKITNLQGATITKPSATLKQENNLSIIKNRCETININRKFISQQFRIQVINAKIKMNSRKLIHEKL